MKKFILCIPIFLLAIANVNAQKKADLIIEIDKLRADLKTSENDLTLSKKQNKVNEAKVQTMENQVKSLKENNEMLLNNMTNFTQLSNKKASNLQKTQEIIKEKDNQLKVIDSALSYKHADNLRVFTVFKNTLGSDSVKIIDGAIYVIIPNSTLFVSDNSNTISATGKPLLEKIAANLNADPSLKIIVEGTSNAMQFSNNMIDNWDLSSLQAASVVRALQLEYNVNPKNMNVLGKSKFGLETVETNTRILIDPKFDEFYKEVKKNMKNKDE